MPCMQTSRFRTFLSYPVTSHYVYLLALGRRGTKLQSRISNSLLFSERDIVVDIDPL